MQSAFLLGLEVRAETMLKILCRPQGGASQSFVIWAASANQERKSRSARGGQWKWISFTHCSLVAKITITKEISLLFQNQLSFTNANKQMYTKIKHFFPGRCNNVCFLFPHSNASGLKQVLPWLPWPIYCSTCKYLKWGQHLSSYKLCDIEITGVFFLRSPVLAMAIAVVLFCFYLYFKRKRTSNNVSIPTTQDDNTSLGFHTASPPGGQAEEHQRCDRFPPRYSTVDHPPPYSLVREPCYSGNDRLLCGKKVEKCLLVCWNQPFLRGFPITRNCPRHLRIFHPGKNILQFKKKKINKDKLQINFNDV